MKSRSPACAAAVAPPFPPGIKWQTVLDTQADQKYIVCNADEGDSGTFADRLLMEADPYQLIEGMTIAGLAVGATEGYIYLRSEYPHCRKVLTEAISRAEQAGFLGAGICGSNRDFRIELRIGAGAYICGEETSLLDSLEGKRGLIRFKPPLPAIEGPDGPAHRGKQRALTGRDQHHPGEGALITAILEPAVRAAR